jgi:hypothetical protein
VSLVKRLTDDDRKRAEIYSVLSFEITKFTEP